jgi:hypothetical protein
MKRRILILLAGVFLCSAAVFAQTNNGYMVTSDLWIRADINTEEKVPIEGVWENRQTSFPATSIWLRLWN